jgi:ribonuclease HI
MKELAASSIQGSPERGRRKLRLYVDGSSKGNPGEGGAGVVIKDEQERTVLQSKRHLGLVTNNIAEYQALILGLQEARQLGSQEVEIYLDSELVVNQINGVYRVRDSKLKTLEGEVRGLLRHFARWVIRHIPREENREADRLAREAVRDKGDQVVAGPDG